MQTKKSLQAKLVLAINPLRADVADTARLQDIETRLAGRAIPENDYLNVLDFIFLLIQEMPEILDADKHNKKLRTVYLFCVQQLAQPHNIFRKRN